jgi:hypothetical protein
MERVRRNRMGRSDLATADAPSRTRLLDGAVALVEQMRFTGAPGRKAAVGFSPEFRVAFPCRGLLVWHVGRDDVVCDANQVLFVTAGERYRMSEPLPGATATSSSPRNSACSPTSRTRPKLTWRPMPCSVAAAAGRIPACSVRWRASSIGRPVRPTATRSPRRRWCSTCCARRWPPSRLVTSRPARRRAYRSLQRPLNSLPTGRRQHE